MTWGDTLTDQQIKAIKHLEVLKEVEANYTSTRAMRKSKKRERLNRAKGRKR